MEKTAEQSLAPDLGRRAGKLVAKFKVHCARLPKPVKRGVMRRYKEQESRITSRISGLPSHRGCSPLSARGSVASRPRARSRWRRSRTPGNPADRWSPVIQLPTFPRLGAFCGDRRHRRPPHHKRMKRNCRCWG